MKKVRLRSYVTVYQAITTKMNVFSALLEFKRTEIYYLFFRPDATFPNSLAIGRRINQTSVMKYFSLFLLFGFLSVIVSCDKEDLDDTSFEEVPFEPTEIEIEDSFIYRVAAEPSQNSAAFALKNSRGGQLGSNYIVVSEDIDVDCSDNGGFGYTFDGGDLFAIHFYGDQNGSYIVSANFDVVVDGETFSVNNFLPLASWCPRTPIELTYEDTGDRLTGTVKGEFFRQADVLVTPFDSCVNFISVGEISASFDVEIVDCN